MGESPEIDLRHLTEAILFCLQSGTILHDLDLDLTAPMGSPWPIINRSFAEFSGIESEPVHLQERYHALRTDYLAIKAATDILAFADEINRILSRHKPIYQATYPIQPLVFIWTLELQHRLLCCILDHVSSFPTDTEIGELNWQSILSTVDPSANLTVDDIRYQFFEILQNFEMAKASKKGSISAEHMLLEDFFEAVLKSPTMATRDDDMESVYSVSSYTDSDVTNTFTKEASKSAYINSIWSCTEGAGPQRNTQYTGHAFEDQSPIQTFEYDSNESVTISTDSDTDLDCYAYEDILEEKALYLANLLVPKSAKRARKVVLLFGAGISTKAGLQVYRENGMHKLKKLMTATSDPSQLIESNKVLNFMRETCRNAELPMVHYFFAKYRNIFQQGQAQLSIYTQNIDSLEEIAGLGNCVLEIHGSLSNIRCTLCSHTRKWELSDSHAFKTGLNILCDMCALVNQRNPRQCSQKQGHEHNTGCMIPDIIRYDEIKSEERIQQLGMKLKEDLRDTDVFIAIGTSLNSSVVDARTIVKRFSQAKRKPKMIWIGIGGANSWIRQHFDEIIIHDCESLFTAIDEKFSVLAPSEKHCSNSDEFKDLEQSSNILTKSESVNISSDHWDNSNRIDIKDDSLEPVSEPNTVNDNLIMELDVSEKLIIISDSGATKDCQLDVMSGVQDVSDSPKEPMNLFKGYTDISLGAPDLVENQVESPQNIMDAEVHKLWIADGSDNSRFETQRLDAMLDKTESEACGVILDSVETDFDPMSRGDNRRGMTERPPFRLSPTCLIEDSNLNQLGVLRDTGNLDQSSRANTGEMCAVASVYSGACNVDAEFFDENSAARPQHPRSTDANYKWKIIDQQQINRWYLA
jgi:NAD-dependent SIR2 family protein deacetylase